MMGWLVVTYRGSLAQKKTVSQHLNKKGGAGARCSLHFGLRICRLIVSGIALECPGLCVLLAPRPHLN